MNSKGQIAQELILIHQYLLGTDEFAESMEIMNKLGSKLWNVNTPIEELLDTREKLVSLL